jgi:hypothetical protein
MIGFLLVKAFIYGGPLLVVFIVVMAIVDKSSDD